MMMMMSSSRAWRVAAVGLSRHATKIDRRHVVTVSRVAFASQGAEQTSSSRNHRSLVALALLTAGTILLTEKHNKADCCGIAGVVGTPSHDAR